MSPLPRFYRSPVNDRRLITRRRGQSSFLPKAIAIAVASCFAADGALANPTGATVVSGGATISQQGNLLSIINTPGAIINWRGFSIGANEITRFIQQSASSSVLNRVVGVDPSIILGTLTSNGRVFLINPNGILFGAGSKVDVAGMVASTLNLSNGDFLAGRLRFTDTPGAGGVASQGTITTPTGGQVYLVAPNVQNSGIINSPQGEIILAAGKTVEIVDSGTPNLRVELTASDNEALNVGQIIANSGKIGIYAGLIRNSGEIRADGVVVGANGEIMLKATKNTTLEAGSTLSASGATGGNITVQSGDTTLVEGTIQATGSEGDGGNVQLLGNLVGLTGRTTVDVSGQQGGGTILVGGDFQGKNHDVQNAWRTYVGSDVMLRADGGTSGDGGKVIVWSDDITRFYGAVNAQGGSQSGNGGFVEISGKYNLDFSGRVNAGAAHGNSGSVLFDPDSITIVAGTAGSGTDDSEVGPSDGTVNFADGGTASFSISNGALQAVIGDVTLQANNSITVNAALDLTTNGQNLTLETSAPVSNITINSPIITNGYMRFYSNSMNINADLTSNNDSVYLIPVNSSLTNINVGGVDSAGVLGLSAAELNHVHLLNPAATLQIGDPYFGGNILVSAALTNGAGGATQNVQNLSLISGWNSTNTISINAPVTVANLLYLGAGGDIQQNGAGVITAPNLYADSSYGVVSLASASNMVDAISGYSGGGSFAFNNAKDLAVGNSFGGITVDGAEGGGPASVAITVTGAGHVLTVNQTISANASNGGTASIVLTSPNGIAINGDGGEGNIGVFANGGYGYDSAGGGLATINLAGGSGAVVLDSYANVTATGGSSYYNGGNAQITVTTTGEVILNNSSSVAAYGGYGGNSGSGNGGSATVNFTGGSTGITLDSNASVRAWGADGGEGTVGNGGAGAISFLTTASGDITLQGNSGLSAAGGRGYDYSGSGNGGTASVTLQTGGTGNILLDNAQVYAYGGDGGSYASAGNGGNGTITLTTAGGIAIQNGSYFEAYGGDAGNNGYGNGATGTIALNSGATGITIDGAEGIAGPGNAGWYGGNAGAATVTLNAGGGPILLDNNASLYANYYYSNDGSADNGTGAAASILLTNASSITLDHNSMLSAHGGLGYTGGGAASVTLNATGAIKLDNGASIHVDGGEGYLTSGNATVTLTASSIALDNNAGIYADGAEGYSVSGNTGGNGAVTLTAGSITMDHGALINVDGGEGYQGGGNATVTLTSSGAGGISMHNGAWIAAYGGEANDGGEGSATTGGAAIIALTANGTGSLNINNSYLYAVGGGGYYNANGGGANVTLTAGSGGIRIENSASVVANGGAGADGAEGYSGDGGAALVTLTTTGGVNILSNASIQSRGGNGGATDYSSGNGGAATLNINSGAAGITIDGAEGGYAVGGNGGYDYGYGGNAAINLNGGSGPILLTNSGSVEAAGGGSNDYWYGGGASISLTTTGSIGVQSGSWISAYGGWGYGDSGLASVSLTAGAGGITLNSASVSADGAEGASVTLGASGPVSITNASLVQATANSSSASVTITSGGLLNIDNSSISATGSYEAYVTLGGTGGVSIDSANIFANTQDFGDAYIGINSAASSVWLTNSSVIVDDGSGGYIGNAEVYVNAASGNVDISGTHITVYGDGGEGSGTGYMSLNASNGYIRGDSTSLLQADSVNTGYGNDALIALNAKSGIGQIGNPIIFANGNSNITAINTGSGDLAIAQATGDIVIDNFSNIINYAPGGAIDLTALTGNMIVNTTVSNPYGSLTVRSGQAGGYIRVDGGAGGFLTTGSGSGHDVSLIADDIDLIAPSASVVQSGSGFINVNTLTPGRAIWLGSSGFLAGQLELTDAELNAMTALGGGGGGLVIGDPTGGALVFQGAVNSSAYLNVRGTSITQAGGATITGGLSVIASGNVTLTDAGNQITAFSTGSNVGGNINIKSAAPTLEVYDVDATGSISFTSVGGAITNPGGGVVNAGGTVSMTAVTGIGNYAAPMIVNSAGAGSSFNNSASGDIAVLSTAPTFTVGGGGANVHNTGGGGYYLSAENNMVVNSGSANDSYAQFFAAGNLATNGYSSSNNVLITAGSVTFNGATVTGALGVIAGGAINVNGNVTAGGISTTSGSINVNGANFDSTGATFFGYTTGDITVAGGGRIYGNPDINLTVGGNIFINGAGSAIEAASPTSIHISFPLLASGGYTINGQPVVYDLLTGTGFVAGGLPAVLGQNLLIEYGAQSVPQDVIQAVNTVIASTNTSVPDDDSKKKDQDNEDDKDNKGEKTIANGLALQCK